MRHLCSRNISSIWSMRGEDQIQQVSHQQALEAPPLWRAKPSPETDWEVVVCEESHTWPLPVVLMRKRPAWPQLFQSGLQSALFIVTGVTSRTAWLANNTLQ